MALLSLCPGWGPPRGRPRGQAHLGTPELCSTPAEVTSAFPRLGGPRESSGTPGCGSPGEAPGTWTCPGAAPRVLLPFGSACYPLPNLISTSIPRGLLSQVRSWCEGLGKFAPRFSPQAGSLGVL